MLLNKRKEPNNMYHTTYLIHFNKNHSKANGQFVSGDGDGDGIANDHANQRKSTRSTPRSKHQNGGYSNTQAYKAGKQQLVRGFRTAAAGDLIAVTGNMLARSISEYSSEAALGARYIANMAGGAANVVGVVNIAKGGTRMAKAAREYNAR